MSTKTLLWPLRAHFRDQGYLVVDECLPAELIDRLCKEVTRQVAQQIAPFRTVDNNIMRLDDLWSRGEVFKELIGHPILMDALKCLLGSNIEFHRYRHNHVTLNRRTDNVSGQGGFGFHADSMQASRPILTVIVYGDEGTVDNGATILIPGSHKWPHVTPSSGGRGGNWLSDCAEYEQFRNQGLCLPMPKGAVLIFDSMLFHTAGTNHTEGTRMSYTLGYRSVDELSRDGRELCELVAGERIYRGNDVDGDTGNWRGGVIKT